MSFQLEGMAMSQRIPGIAYGELLLSAVGEAFIKLNPTHQLRNPVMFVVYVG